MAGWFLQVDPLGTGLVQKILAPLLWGVLVLHSHRSLGAAQCLDVLQSHVNLRRVDH